MSRIIPSPADTVESLCALHQVDVLHARHVAALATGLFDALQLVHQLPDRAKTLVEAGALLHDVGVAADSANHGQAGRDVIVASALQDFDPAERLVLACIAAFHRGPVDPAAEPLYGALPSPLQPTALAVSALVRIADALDDSKSQTTQIQKVDEPKDSGYSHSPFPNPQPPIGLLVSGPYSHEDAARATLKADLWNSLFQPLQIHGHMTRPGITPDDSLARAGRRILRYQVETLSHEQWMPETQSTPRPRQIHALHVATRRLRATLRVFKPYYKSKVVRPLVKGVRVLAESLCAARELDVAVDTLKSYIATAGADTQSGLQPLLEEWRARRKASREALGNYLRGAPHAHWLALFDEFVQSEVCDRPPDPGQPSRVRHAVDVLLARHLAEVRSFDILPAAPDVERIHVLRIAIKRLRYIVVALREVLPVEQADRIVAACVAAQDEYGLLNDAYVTAALALQFVADHRSAGSFASDPAHESALESASDPFVLRGALAFAEHQQQIVEQRLGLWRACLEPLLMI